MLLALEVLGALVFGTAVRGLLNGSARPFVPASIALMAAAVMAITFWSGLWTEGSTLVRQHDRDTKLTLGVANAVAGDLFPANEAFLRFVAANIPPDATVYLYCGPGDSGCPGGLDDWIGFRLSPRVIVSDPARAQWVVVYGANPATAPVRFGAPLKVFGREYALGRRL
jgi:hypothetical protein